MNLLTTEEAAGRLGVTPARVRVLIREGRLPAAKFGRAHMIAEKDLPLVADRKPGRPAKELEPEVAPKKPARRKGAKTNGR